MKKHVITPFYVYNKKVKIPDKYFQKKVNSIQVSCIHRETCQWQGTLAEYRDEHYYAAHMTQFVEQTCPHCSLSLKSQQELDTHLDLDNGTCPKQPLDCMYKPIGCTGYDTKASATTTTTTTTTTTATAVPTETVENMSSGEQETPRDSSTCLTRENMSAHMSLNMSDHLALLYKHLESVKAELDARLKLANTSNTSNGNGNGYNAATVSTSSSARYPLTKSQSASSNAHAFAASAGAVAPNLNTSANDHHQQLFSTHISPPHPQQQQQQQPIEIDANVVNALWKCMHDLNGKVDSMTSSQRSMVADLARLNKSNEKLRYENQMLREGVAEYRTICQDLHKTVALTQVSLITLEERLMNLEKLSHNGSSFLMSISTISFLCKIVFLMFAVGACGNQGQLMWKITNVHERIQEAKSGRQTSFYSPPFYTHKNGFKVCLRIYLNGDGNGRNTHISLFFVILRGEYDALLRWPFRQKVMFLLIDQSMSESRENVYDAFRPDPNSSSFRRPESEMNIASGLPCFCPLGKLMSPEHEYIKDNTMFIKITVDTKDLVDNNNKL